MSSAPLYDGIVMFDYDAVESTEITVKKGKYVVVKEVNDSGWALVKVDGKSGWIPSDYIDKIDPKAIQAMNAKPAAAPAAGGADAAPSDASKAAAGVTDALNNLKVDAANAQGVCAKCGDPITDRCVVAKDKNFHVEHFNCDACGKSLAGQPFMEKDGQFFCEDDYYRKFNPPCEACNDVIRGQYVTALGKAWHQEHFVCTECSKPFKDKFRKHDGKPYCDDDFNKLFGAHCSKCNKVIDGQVFEALGKKFHLDCFTCEVENHKIGQDSHFHVYEDGVYCPEHFEALFTQKCSECSKPILEQYVKVLDDHFHPDCWKCTECKTTLNKDNCDQYQGKFYCKACNIKQVAKGGSSAAAAPAAASAPQEKKASGAAVQPTTTSGPSKKPPIVADEKNPVAGQEYYPYQVLKEKGNKLPAGVDASKKEDYLAPDVFEKIFKMKKEDFKKLKAWKKKKLKQNVGLF